MADVNLCPMHDNFLAHDFLTPCPFCEIERLKKELAALTDPEALARRLHASPGLYAGDEKVVKMGMSPGPFEQLPAHHQRAWQAVAENLLREEDA